MTVRNLDAIFRPRSVVLVGASAREKSVGRVLARNLAAAGFKGPLFLVNPKGGEVEGRPIHRAIADLPEAPDLAIVTTPPDAVPGVIAELGAKGTRGAVVITAGFGEGGSQDGAKRRQAMLDAAKPNLLRIVGPNCLGLASPGRGVNGTFLHMQPKPGRIAFVSQSGAVLAGVVDWAAPRGVGFSHLLSLGDMSDVDFGDCLDWLATDEETGAILLYVEAVTSARKFMSAARAASRLKPVVVMKAGRHAEGAKAASSHTGALAGADEVYDAAFRRAGMLRVTTLAELFDAVEILSSAPRIRGDRLAIVTNGGGFGVLATDELMDVGGRLAELSAATMAKLDAALPATWSRGNPIDIIGDAPGARYAAALAALAEDDGVDAALVMNCPTAIASSIEAADAVVGAAKAHPGLPLVCAWIGDSAEARTARRRLDGQDLPVYATPGEATRAFMYLVRHRRSQEELMQTPPAQPEAFSPDRTAARAAVEAALADGREWLTEPEAKAVLAAYAIPTVATARAATPEAAVAEAERIGFPVALKILSPDITHKSDMGGVALDLDSAAAVGEAARTMLERIRRAAPDARIEGFTVQQMVRRPGAIELILGLSEDRQFGPVVLFGQGGVAVEVMKDKALALPPLNMALAHDLIGRTRVAGLLRGYRDRKPADLDQVALTLIKVAQIAADLPQVSELDVNPLLADPDGVIALDARIRVRPAKGRGEARLAIRPYPSELEETVEAAGRRFLLRPIRPEDEPALREAFRRLSPEAVRLRFFAPMKDLSHSLAARLTQIDYDREMALVLIERAPAGRADIAAVVRIAADPDNERAEFAVTVGDELTGRGVGSMLMQRIVDYARRRGVGEVFGLILRDNIAMLEIAKRLGFSLHDAEAEHVEARLKLRP